MHIRSCLPCKIAIDNYKLNYKAFSEAGVEDWLRTITAISVNDTLYTQAEYAGSVSYDSQYNVYVEDKTIYLGGQALKDGAENMIVLTSGKDTLTLRVTSDLKIEVVN